MYTEADWVEVTAQWKRRWIITLIPIVLLLGATIASYVILHNARNESGWIWTGMLTVLCGGTFLFLYGVLVRPVAMYRRHLAQMLRGRMRETTGVLREIDEQVKERDGIECLALMVNVGEKNDPEDDRLFYYDLQKGKPAIELGSRVTVRSNDRMISELRLAEE